MKLCLICNFQTAGEQDICPRDGSSMVTVGDDPLLGVVVEGRYKIESVIGQGSAGTVYKAIQELIGREVAIKVLHDYLVSDQEFIKRFTQEAKASSRLSHPNIITIYDFGVIPQGGRPYIAMDLLRGTPLSDMLVERNHLEIDETIPIFKQVCSALAEAHRQGVVHRDIKPENIVLVERSGQKLFPIVVDFGIARLVQEESDVARITRTGTVCGSPTYMSPEQCTSSKVDHRSDIYSLGIVIYETLTGEVPFLSDELVKVMAMHLSDPPKPLNQVREDLHFPQSLEEVVYKALAKNPDQRYQTMEEFSQALEDSVKQPEAPVVVTAPVMPKRPEIHPGPLAQSPLAHNPVPQSALSTQSPEVVLEEQAIRKQTKEMSSAGRPMNKMDLATRALEELRSSGAYDDRENFAKKTAAAAAARAAAAADNGDGATATAHEQPAFIHTPRLRSPSDAPALSTKSFSRGRKKPGVLDNVFAAMPTVIILVLLVGGAGGVYWLGNHDPRIAHYLPWKTGNFDPDELMRQGRNEQALFVLNDLKQQGKLTKPQTETLAKVLVAQAKQSAKDKKYDEAVRNLEQVQGLGKTAQSDVAKQLLKKYHTDWGK